MTARPPDFDELFDDDLDLAERERLRRVHELLIAAGPPPELSPVLEERERARENVFPLFPRRRRAAAFALAAALGIVAFGAGFLVGDRGDDASPDRVVAMAAPAGTARASLAIFAVDDAGNWPMELTVRDLAPLPEGETYELWLTKQGKLAASCGTFVVAGGKTVVPLNAPFRFRQFDGWVVVRTGTTEPVLTT
jgi:hypothetical protein